MDMSDSVPASNLDRALYPNSLAPTLGLQRREYWEEINPLLAKWKNVNDTHCPECARIIPVNMARHLRLVHSDYVCFWRCPVARCSLWFTSELNAKDYIENIHRFREGRSTTFYECLWTYGLEWFGSRSFFDGRRPANEALWMDLALAHRSGQELRNHYVVTRSPEYAPLRRFFNAAVDHLQLVYNALLVTSAQPQSLIATMCAAVEDCDDLSSEGSLMLLSPPHDIHDATLPVGTTSSRPPAEDAVSPVVMTRRITPANRALQYLEAGHLGASDPHHMLSRPSVPDLCIASSNLLSVVDPLPLDRLSRHTVAAIRSWPSTDRRHILAVANIDMRVARQNLAELMLYMDDHATHIANCAPADDDDIPLMSAEASPRLEGGVWAALEEVDHS